MRDPHFPNLRTVVKTILDKPFKYSWTLQGLGMLRLHLGNNTRLHIWDTRFAFPSASPIHDHLQWDLTSTIISGSLNNYRFFEHPGGQPYHWSMLKAGIGGHLVGEPKLIGLIRREREEYKVGETYRQEPNEIHETVPMDGTVTIMRKSPTEQSDAARVFWPEGTEWGTALPRDATVNEVSAITNLARDRWITLPGENWS